MRAMMLEQVGKPLALRMAARPSPGAGEILVKVAACAVCRTDLHIVDGDLPTRRLPLVPGHEIVGRVVAAGAGVEGFAPGDRVGIPWLAGTCGACRYCRSGRENLCESARFTGYTVDGGYADFAVADARFCFPVPEAYADEEAAPLMCAGLIGFRAYRKARGARRLGLYGFGAAAHLIAQVAIHEGCEVYAFAKPGDEKGQSFARSLGAVWAGGSDEPPPDPLDAAIIFAPVGALVPAALAAVEPGGTVVCAGIHMSDVPSFPYALLWRERTITSVANLTREDGIEFLKIAPQVPVKTAVHPYPLERANDALDDLRRGRFEGAAVLTMR
ncbi:zinc-dependent alcohol dehydrogenase family protein [Amphiplicatus metriothermophilus]|uniref:alcohol dehydrogenase n=1 Tax=Amphiplicatus metriothermophilus TaxID=1519374 RepID=A0A239PTB8_9PROT|nr:zinc-dependent alcohol dehydrogenase family protein [Amphiplicatus metriothermophilus]MBB5519299.1 propanol-preferring alcohol dehydrogenase [Amphiplicatus metriothermophilus]SNT73368.1 alcohol dehydrogenase, propanol-preferring [Amphiplicatus metriothermophilus]